jgi:uncharacterized protein YndB with AHSA1/START domain
MTMTSPKSVISPDLDSIVTEIHIAAPAERVFKALTDERELPLWFTNSSCPVKVWQMDARPGGHYRYTTQKGTVVNDESECNCHGDILQIDPPHLLVYSWVANWHDDKSRVTVVRWELTPDATGTRLKVTHSGLAHEPASRKDYSGGWPGVLDALKQFTEN